eukprot:TRINITY_DN4543_c0_g1_i2.p1 TRINITY_DN4543_c0_g1~~TRINITY_DN4543_c0_g1_i2.p1  ORF type:complete len:248 (-),score=28.92 TRINITY_DN4543_c0_g1_i2:47-790(-)
MAMLAAPLLRGLQPCPVALPLLGSPPVGVQRQACSTHAALAVHARGAAVAAGLACACAQGLRHQRARGASARDKVPPTPPRPPPKPEFDPKRQVGVTAPFGFFDPLGLCPKDAETFFEYRTCEIKHGRVAMMASLGAVAQHYVRIPGFNYTTWGEKMPAGIGAVWSNPGTFGCVLLVVLAAALEQVFWREDAERGAGNYGDPLGLGQYNEDMRNRELNNGRMAMFSAAGIIVAELATGRDAVQQLGM